MTHAASVAPRIWGTHITHQIVSNGRPLKTGSWATVAKRSLVKSGVLGLYSVVPIVGHMAVTLITKQINQSQAALS